MESWRKFSIEFSWNSNMFVVVEDVPQLRKWVGFSSRDSQVPFCLYDLGRSLPQVHASSLMDWWLDIFHKGFVAWDVNSSVYSMSSSYLCEFYLYVFVDECRKAWEAEFVSSDVLKHRAASALPHFTPKG